MRDCIKAETAYPVCLYCEMELKDVVMNDYELDDVWAYFYYIGTCSYCKRKYKWSEQYKWDEKFYGLEEVSKG